MKDLRLRWVWAFRGCRHSGVSQPESSRRCAGDRQNVVGDGIFSPEEQRDGANLYCNGREMRRGTLGVGGSSCNG